jgi:hypothetical protein
MKLRWSRWVELFLECTVASCRHTVHLLRELRSMANRWHERVEARRTRKHATAWRVADLLLGQPVVTVTALVERLKVTLPAANGPAAIGAIGGGRARRSPLTSAPNPIRFRITMSTKASIRDLRNHFPKVRRLVESQGEVLLTEKGQPRYRLTLYSPASKGEPPPADYWARLNAYQPKTLTKAQASALYDENRGER